MGRAGWLEAVLRTLPHFNIGIGFLQEEILTKRIHTHYSAGYNVWATEVEIRHQGGIAIILG